MKFKKKYSYPRMISVSNILIVVFSICFSVLVLSVFTADRYYSASRRAVNNDSSYEKALSRIDAAARLDPLNADILFRKYELLGEWEKIASPEIAKDIPQKRLRTAKQCIELRPLWAKYHLYYGLALSAMSPNPNIVTRELILSQLKKASELKPTSTVYREIYERENKR